MFNADQFKSFCERYVLERASSFKPETELQDLWNAVERAKQAYMHIEYVVGVEQEKEYARLRANENSWPQPSSPMAVTRHIGKNAVLAQGYGNKAAMNEYLKDAYQILKGNSK